MTTLSVPDMSCGHCKAAVETALTPLAGSVTVDLAARQVVVTGASDVAPLLHALGQIGFPATVLPPNP